MPLDTAQSERDPAKLIHDGPAAGILRLERRLARRVIGASLLLLAIATGLISREALRAFDREVFPNFAHEAEIVGDAARTQLERAVSVGLPLAELPGSRAFLASYLVDEDSIEYLVVADAEGRVLHDAYNRIGGARGKPAKPPPPQTFAPPEDRASSSRIMRPTPTGFDIVLPILGQGTPVAWLHVGVNRVQLDRAAEDSQWDILIVLLVALLATIEFLSFLIDRAIGAPLRLIDRLMARVSTRDWTTQASVTARDEAGHFLARLNTVILDMNASWQSLCAAARAAAPGIPGGTAQTEAILARVTRRFRFAEGTIPALPPLRSAVTARTPLFLYVFAEQLSTSFIPLYARDLFTPQGWSAGWISEQWAIGLPITAFMAMIALATPYGGRLVARIGARRVLMLGCIPAAIGYTMTALAGSVEAFVLWRAITAIGYAFITIACQGYLAETSDTTKRASAMAVFVSAVMTGAVCGTAIGAVLAERVGFRYTFAMSAVITCLVGVLAQHSMEANAGRRMAAKTPVLQVRRVGKSVLVEAMSNPRFAGLVLLAAIPAKIVLSSFVFYLTPLYLSNLDLSQPAIGRNVMLYGLTMLITIPLGALASDRLRATGGMIVLAGVATGLGMLAPRFVGPDIAIPVAIALTGLCQGLASAPMLALVPDICPRETARHGVAALLGYLRLGERLGSIAGPLLAASLVAMVGYVDAISLIGLLSLITALLYALVVGLPDDPPEKREQTA